MKREQLAHILRAAAKIAQDPAILVIGSQAILGSHSEDELPQVAWLSIEADIAFLDDIEGQRKADEVDGAIGELSTFHESFGYYGQGVDLTTATLPDGWRDRLIPFHPSSADPAQAVCLEKHDLVISKLAANREKDKAFASALLQANLVDVDILLARAVTLSSVVPPVRRQVQSWLNSKKRKGPEDPDRR